MWVALHTKQPVRRLHCCWLQPQLSSSQRQQRGKTTFFRMVATPASVQPPAQMPFKGDLR
jgi:hypothetical protein